jgi:acetyl esterase/lipase
MEEKCMADFTRRDIARFGVMMAGVAFVPASFAVAETPVDPIRFVNPELRPAWLGLRQWSANLGKPGATAAPPGMAIPTMGPDWVARKIAGRNGAPDVKIYVHGAKAGTTRPAILHIHGGGYTGGAAMLSMGMLNAIAAAIDCVILTVDYRLAPGTPFPGSLEDNYAALLWLHKQASELGVDTSRIAVMGESAGGGHAAMLAIAARDRGEVPLAFQALIYPMLDDRTGSDGKVPPPYNDAVTWTRENNAKGWSALLGVAAGSAVVPAGSVPARVAEVRGLPPTYIAVGSIDIFVDEDIAFAQRLIDAGISVELNVVPGAYHGFDLFAPKTEVTRKFIERLVQALSEALRLA